MARLQDFPSVTPSDSDKILIVQSQGQGLATFGSTLGAKMDKANPTGTGALSLNRKSGTTVGYLSTTEGIDGTATGNYSHAGGYQGVATSFASYADGQSCEASGYTAHAHGIGTKANHRSQFVFGEYNTADASTADATAKGNYIEVVGKGTSDANRSNARTLDWSGNEVLAGDLTINGNKSVGAALSALGTVVTGTTPSSVAVADGTVTEIESITLEAGTWLVIACADWAANATGYRQIALSAGANPSRDRAVTTPTAGSGKETYQQIIQIITVNSQTAQKVYAMQNSGSSINVFPSVKAIRII